MAEGRGSGGWLGAVGWVSGDGVSVGGVGFLVWCRRRREGFCEGAVDV
jgi:hypothetical protein